LKFRGFYLKKSKHSKVLSQLRTLECFLIIEEISGWMSREDFLERRNLCIVWSWEKIYEQLQQDLKLFLFILSIICLFRIGFIIDLHTYMSDMTTGFDIMAALYYGLRISLKSAGFLGGISVILCAAIYFVNKNKVQHFRFCLGTSYIGLLSVLFYARIPYYEQFHMGFNQLLFNTFQDDTSALFYTLIQQYHLPFRLLLAVLTTVILSCLFKKWLNTGTFQLPRFSSWHHTVVVRIVFLIVLYFIAVFIRFGGSMTYAHNIDWENSGITKDQLLNEAILDDVQALYRAYELHERLITSTGIDIDPAQMHEYGSYLAGRSIESNNLDDYLKKTAQGSAVKPKHIFLIIGESYANWPLLPEYGSLNIANGVKKIIQQDNAAYVPTFLPNGMSTISGVLGVVTGLTDVNLYLNYLPEAYQEPFSTAIAPQMKRLGYQPRFWYAGPSSWEKIKDFTLAQGFEDFHGSGDFENAAGNVWGCDDKYLFNAVLSQINQDKPSFNVILTVSNHAPFTVDLAKEGFDRDSVIAGLPDDRKNDEELIKQLGHFWYADKVMTQFIAKVRQQYPDSLFMIMGDHADRLNIEVNPGLYKRYGIPLIAYGPGITKNVFPKNAAGSHINVTPTLIELVAPKGFHYYSIGESLTKGNDFGMNYGFWITRNNIGKADSDVRESITGEHMAEPPLDQIEQAISRLRSVSWWRIKHGTQLTIVE
jgi:phosphoglycerol transferase MdoB-like AlkP superfamily enzyme